MPSSVNFKVLIAQQWIASTAPTQLASVYMIRDSAVLTLATKETTLKEKRGIISTRAAATLIIFALVSMQKKKI
jgi:hypothetical protein